MRARNEKHVDAISLMQHYFRWLADKADVYWTSDNDQEIERLCDLLVDASRGDDD